MRRLAVGALVSAMTLIGGFEGYKTYSYWDGYGGVSTACFGSTKGIGPNQKFKPEECAGLLARDVIEASYVLDCFKFDLTENQQTAVTSLAYNAGTRAICESTLVRLANAGQPPSVWCEQFTRWNKAGGVVLPGLVKRRAKERELCLTDG